MKKQLLTALCLAVAWFGSALAQSTPSFDIRLWETGYPNTNAHGDSVFARGDAPADRPFMRVYLADSARNTGRVVVALPGGGYTHLASQHEGYDWAPFFNERGISLFVLNYRMPFGNDQVPQSDVYEGIRIIRERAAEWGINPHDVGIMGSSAGGHLASTVAINAQPEVRPDFQILFYPVISMDQKITHMGSRINLLGDAPTDQKVKDYSGEKKVRRTTPPAIIFCNDDDDVVRTENSTGYYQALRKHHIAATLYVLPQGGHGWGSRPSFRYHGLVEEALSKWLEETQVKTDALRVACVGNSITDGMGVDLRPYQSYPAQMKALLGPDYVVRNFGICSRTMMNTGDYPYMRDPYYKEALAFNPDIVVIKLGTNDTKPGNWDNPDADFEGDSQAMIDAFKACPSHPRILLAYPATAFENPYTIRDSIVVNNIIPIIDQLSKVNGLEIIDLHSATNHKSLFVADGVHPNRKGAALIAKTVADAIQHPVTVPVDKKAVKAAAKRAKARAKARGEGKK